MSSPTPDDAAVSRDTFNSNFIEHDVVTASETSPPTALFRYALETYNKMADQAEMREVDGRMGLVYEGMLTKLMLQEIGLSVPYYTSITRALKRMSCIEQLRRGGGNSPSAWLLLREPTEELFTSTMPKRERKPTKTEQLSQRVNDLASRVNMLEELVHKLVNAA